MRELYNPVSIWSTVRLPGTQRIMSYVPHTAGLETSKKRKFFCEYPELNHNSCHTAHMLVTIPASIYFNFTINSNYFSQQPSI